MNPEMQQPMSGDRSAAALAFATKLSEGMIPKTPGLDASQTPETAPSEEKKGEPKNDESNVRDMIKQELSPIIELLKDLLKEDGQDKA